MNIHQFLSLCIRCNPIIFLILYLFIELSLVLALKIGSNI